VENLTDVYHSDGGEGKLGFRGSTTDVCLSRLRFEIWNWTPGRRWKLGRKEGNLANLWEYEALRRT
jgi:hypothetical protein